MQLYLTRYDFTSSRTIGQLAIAGSFECYTLEDAVHDGPKVAGQTAIPYGRYAVELTFSQRFQTVLPLLLDVPGFTGIRIHAGNTAADTAGCILVGQARDGDSVLHSRHALNDLLVRMQAIPSGEPIWLTIED